MRLRATPLDAPIVDGRPSNVFFLDLPIEHSGGGAFAQIVVDEGYTPLVSKVDLADYVHIILDMEKSA